MKKSALMVLTVLLSMGMVLSAFSAVSAQDESAQEESSKDYILEEIIVTAQKRETNVQQTPVAITAFDDDMLNGKGILDQYSLQDNVPGMNSQFAGNRTWSKIWIRGIGTDIGSVGADGGVAFHMDGVYQKGSFAASQPIFDMERVEVLRGPQGTLYGRNATGGAINYVTKKPTSEFEGYADVLGGSYDMLRTRGAINIPIKKDKLHFRTAWQTEDRDGYTENLTTGNPVDSIDSRSFRGHLQWLITPNIDVLLSYTREDYKGGVPAKNVIGNFQTGILVPAFPTVGTWNGIQYTNAKWAKDPREIREDTDNDENNSFEGLYLKLNWNLGGVVVSSLTANHKEKYKALNDLDHSDQYIQNMEYKRARDQWVQELQLISAFGGPFEFITGLFYFDEESNDYNGGPGAILDGYAADQKIDNQSYAGYAQASYELTDKLKLTGGIRYTKDKKKSVYDVFIPWVFITYNPADYGSGVFYPMQYEYEQDWNETTWKGIIDYQLSDQNFLYTSVASGYKGGGTSQGLAGLNTYDPEYVLSYEAGSKNKFLDNRLQVNFSAYYSEYTDLQLMTWKDLTRATTNAAKATIQGFELDLIGRPTRGFELGGSVAFLDATFDEYRSDDSSIPGTAVEDLSGNQLPKTPKWTVKLNAQYTVDMGKWGFLTPRIDFYWQDEIYTRAFNKTIDELEAYIKTDVTLNYESFEGKWYAKMFVRNIQDNDDPIWRSISGTFYGSLVTETSPSPRTFGFNIGYRF
ncbi:MAG: TonB-dependent receptor [Deltaproteobacteria bacterium]|nr:TonB-dependent receptor [Deltaproteobacteria bacterium]